MNGNIRDSVISGNAIGIYRFNGVTTGGALTVDRCSISYNATAIKLAPGGLHSQALYMAASTIHHNTVAVDKVGITFLTSLGNNSADVAGIFDITDPLQ